MKTIIATAGHTAAGKTSAARCLSAATGWTNISEGEIKRELRPSYSTNDSLDETLRDCAYKIAIERAHQILSSGAKQVILDASFHRRFRREWLYEMSRSSGCALIWLYCNCPDVSKVRDRISSRQTQTVKAAHNHADSMAIFRFIIETFDPLSIDEIPDGITGSLLSIDTSGNTVSCECTGERYGDITNVRDSVLQIIEAHLRRFNENCGD